MDFPSLDAFLASPRPTAMPAGPVAVVLAETRYLLAATVARLRGFGAAAVIVVGPDGAGTGDADDTVAAELATPGAAAEVLNRLIGAFAGRWIAWCFNAEFLFFPWCETRTLDDISTFLAGERRRALYSYALDLYADPLPEDATAPEAAGLMFDATGYHAFPQEDGRLDIYGALGWRFEGMIPAAAQHIGRPALFRAAKGLTIGPEMRFDSADYASVACRWHHNPTGAVMTLRRARMLMGNPGFAEVRDRLVWAGTKRFEWTSEQLLDLGMIEPGQWF